MKQMQLRTTGGEILAGVIGQGTALEFCASAGSLRQAVGHLRLGADLGMTLIDTAPSYEYGLAEVALGRALGEARDRFVVATKFPPECSAPDRLTASVESSLRRLHTDVIDLLQIHWPHATIPLAETLDAMVRLVERGLVRALGLGNCTAEQLDAALAGEAAPHLVAVQQELSLAQRTAATDILPLCQKHGLALLAYSPLGRGRVLASGRGPAVLARLAARLERSPATVALAWLAAEPGVIPIPKASSENHLRQNAAAGALALAPEDRLELALAFEPQVEEIDPARIVVQDDDPTHPTYTTLAQARANGLGLVPGPTELAARIAAGELLKPVRIAPLGTDATQTGYRLLEGRVRYWAWVIAWQGRRPITAIVEAPGLEEAA